MQKTVKKARQQNEAKVKQWREEAILELKMIFRKRA
ncbi:hypothetical protein [Runella sp.]